MFTMGKKKGAWQRKMHVVGLYVLIIYHSYHLQSDMPKSEEPRRPREMSLFVRQNVSVASRIDDFVRMKHVI
jgi:hypothetical protein